MVRVLFVSFLIKIDSSFEDASILDDSSNKNGESDTGGQLLDAGSRRFIAELPRSESFQLVSGSADEN